MLYSGLYLKRFAQIILSLFLATNVSIACVREKAHRVKTSSDLRQVIVGLTTYTHSGGVVIDDPENFRDIEDLIRLLVEEVGLTDASFYLNYADKVHFEEQVPEITGAFETSGKFKFNPEILDFPIGFSFAVYPDLKGPSSATPILWTRGLHRYEEFDASYGGHVVFLDGHVVYVTGDPGKPEQDLIEIFGPNSEYSKVLRILEHVPETWESKGLEPLPIRLEEYRPYSHQSRLGIWVILTFPALIGAALVALVPKSTIRERAWAAFLAFGIILILTLILVPSVC